MDMEHNACELEFTHPKGMTSIVIRHRFNKHRGEPGHR
jgi:hypothetical protein